MKRHSVFVSDAAHQDLRDIVEFISKDNPSHAQHWLDQTLEALESPSIFPGRCPSAPEQSLFSGEMRHLILSPYRVIFRIDALTVTILRVRHAARRPARE
jgi:plasmid stabilization system protein ParE